MQCLYRNITGFIQEKIFHMVFKSKVLLELKYFWVFWNALIQSTGDTKYFLPHHNPSNGGCLYISITHLISIFTQIKGFSGAQMYWGFPVMLWFRAQETQYISGHFYNPSHESCLYIFIIHHFIYTVIYWRIQYQPVIKFMFCVVLTFYIV